MKISEKNLKFFAEKIWENIWTYFQKFSAKMFRFWSKNGWFYKILEIKKKNLPKWKIWVSRACARKTGFFFFLSFCCFFPLHCKYHTRKGTLYCILPSLRARLFKGKKSHMGNFNGIRGRREYRAFFPTSIQNLFPTN